MGSCVSRQRDMSDILLEEIRSELEANRNHLSHLRQAGNARPRVAKYFLQGNNHSEIANLVEVDPGRPLHGFIVEVGKNGRLDHTAKITPVYSDHRK